MDKDNLIERLDKIEGMIIEITSLIEVTADSCERNDLTSQELPLRLACEKQDDLLEEVQAVSINLEALAMCVINL